ncbi:MAG TPA: aspartyl protease family protein [Candidatus Cybelea sp.]|jgi:predicted aspartyl protease|nr:aspartyl protease family protein [Candidatus Cybelea sp.]
MVRLLCFVFVVFTTFAPLYLPASAAAPAQDATAAELLAKHRAYVGWQFGDGSFDSLRISGKITANDGRVTQTFVTLFKGLLFRDTRTFSERANSTWGTGFTGGVFWSADDNGFTTPIYGDYAKYLASFTVLQEEGTTELPARFIEKKTVDGKLLSVVRVTLVNAFPIDCYVDPQTGAYARATIDPGGSYETTINIVSYGEIAPGKKFMNAYRFGESKDTQTSERAQPNVPVTDEDLHPPAPIAAWSFGNGTPTPITVTHDRILIDATINGRKGRFILDTGADSIVLDDLFADKAGVAVLPAKAEGQTLYGRIKSQVRRVDTIQVGDATMRNVLIYSQDFRSRDYRGLDRTGYDGLIGYDFFAGAIVKLDVYLAKMTILDPSTDLSAQRGLPIFVDLSEGVPAIPMMLNKSIAVNAMLDTGNPGIVFIPYELAKKHGLPVATLGCGTFDTLTIGPITYAGQAVCLGGLWSNYMLLGLDFLKHFDYVFDYPHGRMFVEPNKN